MSTPDVYGDNDGITLRDRMASRIFEAVEISAGCDCVVDVRSYDVADAILALVHDAMMAERVVRAGAQAITADPFFGHNTWVDDARNVITAALEVAGVTKGENDDDI